MRQGIAKRWALMGVFGGLLFSSITIASEQGGDMQSERAWEEGDVSQVASGHVRNWLLRTQSDLRRERERVERWIEGPDQEMDFVLHARSEDTPLTAVLYYGEPSWVEVWCYREQVQEVLSMDVPLRGPLEH